MPKPIDTRKLDRHWNCRLTTTGRTSGQRRSVTIWFVLSGDKLYLTGSPDGPHWARNLRANPVCEAVIGGQLLHGRARIIDSEPEAAAVRQRFVDKYLLARLARPFGGYTASVAVEVTLQGVGGA